MATTVTNSSATSNPDYDVKISTTVDGQVQHVNVDNILSGLNLPEYDNGEATFPIATQTVWTLKLAAVTVATVTLTYTDATKETLLSFAKT